MDLNRHDYTRDPQRALFLFSAEWEFSEDVLDHVHARPDGASWYLAAAQRLSETTWQVEFQTSEYLDPSAPQSVLRLRVKGSGDFPNMEYTITEI